MPFGNRGGQGGRGGRGRQGGNRRGVGPNGSCVCPKCGTRVPHRTGVPCNSEPCPQCGTRMRRE